MNLARIIPASTIPAKGSLIDEMFPLGNHPWSSFESEIDALMKIMIERAKEKIFSARCDSVIALQGGILTPTIDIEWKMLIGRLKQAGEITRSLLQERLRPKRLLHCGNFN
jgi:hypothetical protein